MTNTWPTVDPGHTAETFGRVVYPGDPVLHRKILGDLGLIDGDLSNLLTRGDIEGALDKCVAKFLTKSYRYSSEPWEPARPQRIRDAGWVNAECGTCLDYALALSSLLLYCSGLVLPDSVGRRGALQPFLLLNRWSQASGHAVVVVPLTIAAQQRLRRMVGLSRQAVLDQIALSQIRAADVRIVDLAMAVKHRESGPGASLTFGEAHIAASARWTGNHLVDLGASVEHLAETGASFWNPLTETRPSVSRRLPIRSDYLPLDSRAETLDKLSGARGLSVITGLSGSGKSMLALEVAKRADAGHGWFLNASSVNVLVAELAEAELAEAGLEVASQDRVDRQETARLALARLRSSTSPWVVVLDNAEQDLLTRRDLLPTPNPERGQHLIVTTTAPELVAGLAHPGPTVLEALEAGDLPDAVKNDTDLTKECGGSALAVFAANAFLTETKISPSALLAHKNPPDDRPPLDRTVRMLWRAFVDLRANDHDEVEGARRLAWLPPEHATAEFDDLASGWLGALARTGLVRLDPSTASMHRSVSAAIRDDEPPSKQRERAVMLLNLPQIRDVLDSNGDAATFDQFEAALALDVAESNPRVRTVRAIMTLASLFELFGLLIRSRDLYEKAEVLAKDLTGEDHDLWHDCIFGQARYANQQIKDVAVLEHWESRLGESVEHHRLKAERADASASDSVALHRFAAMQALLQIKVVENTDQPATDWAVSLLTKAESTLRSSLSARRSLLGEDHPDTARAIYNLGRAHVNWAKFAPLDEVEHHHEQAEEAYRSALETRLRIYVRELHPHIASSHWGLALVGYERARAQLVRLGADDGEARARVYELLRTATQDAETSLRIREYLEGPVDGGDTEKSTRLLGKIMSARFLARPAKDSVTNGAETRKLIDEIERELQLD